MNRCLPALVLSAVASAQEPAVDFVRDVAPLLQRHCVSCHGEEKQKGDLRLDAKAHVFPDGEASELVVAGKPDDSELVRRVELPDGDEDLMPQKGERLKPAEVAALRAWIAAGATWPEAADAWFAEKAKAMVVPKIDFGIAAPDAATGERIDAALRALEKRGIVAQRIAADTPAIDVNASLLGRAFTDADLALLADLAPVLVWLDLGRTAVTDEGMKSLAGFGELRRLVLANTAVGDQGLAALGALPKVAVLNAYGSKATDQGLLALATWPALRTVYAFETAVTKAGAEALAAQKPGLVVDRGDYAAERAAAAELEIAEREERQRPANATCLVSGEKPSAEHFVDVDGLRVQFCCEKCKAKYTADPAAFATKVDELRAQREREREAKKANGGTPPQEPAKADKRP